MSRAWTARAPGGRETSRTTLRKSGDFHSALGKGVVDVDEVRRSVGDIVFGGGPVCKVEFLAEFGECQTSVKDGIAVKDG